MGGEMGRVFANLLYRDLNWSFDGWRE